MIFASLLTPVKHRKFCRWDSCRGLRRDLMPSTVGLWREMIDAGMLLYISGAVIYDPRTFKMTPQTDLWWFVLQVDSAGKQARDVPNRETGWCHKSVCSEQAFSRLWSRRQTSAISLLTAGSGLFSKGFIWHRHLKNLGEIPNGALSLRIGRKNTAYKISLLIATFV